MKKYSELEIGDKVIYDNEGRDPGFLTCNRRRCIIVDKTEFAYEDSVYVVVFKGGLGLKVDAMREDIRPIGQKE
jgi:hypothetical protein